MTAGDLSVTPPATAAAACRSLPDASDRPVVSVVVPTRNSSRHLAECLRSIRAQTYPAVELIVVDNHSVDGTLEIARRYADVVFTAGPERSAQVNAGVHAATGTYVFRVDGDFRLEPDVVAECIEHMRRGEGATVVHNTADQTVGRLARVRKFEVDMYKYSLDHTAARFLSRDLFLAVGGLREDVTAGEDYDFQNRLRRAGVSIGFASAEAVHLDEPTQIMPVLRKYFRYGRDFPNYRRYNRTESRQQLSFVRRDYLRNWRRFLAHPALAGMFIAYHCSKFAAGAVGYATAFVVRRPPAPADVGGNNNRGKR
jgi:glycosyltransferase involved in cell wall biosynthesis